MKNGYIIVTSTSVDVQEIVKSGGKKVRFTKLLFIEKILK